MTMVSGSPSVPLGSERLIRVGIRPFAPLMLGREAAALSRRGANDYKQLELSGGSNPVGRDLPRTAGPHRRGPSQADPRAARSPNIRSSVAYVARSSAWNGT